MSDRPRVVVSACLLGERVRYDGRSAEDPLILKLTEEFERIPVCPELSVGLGVPREKIIVYREEKEIRVSQPATGLELTQRLKEFAGEFLESVGEVDGFILKSRSPSCGVSRTKTYLDPDGRVYAGLGKGLFALEVLRRFPLYPVEDEVRIRRERNLYLFLAKAYTLFFLRSRKDLSRVLLEHLRPWTPRSYMRAKGLIAEGKDAREILLRSLERLPEGVLREIYVNLSERI